MPGGRTKARITVAIDPVLAKGIDERARGKGTTRSALVEEAVSEWLRRQIEEDYGALDKAEGQLERDGVVAAGMVLEALRHQFPAMREVTDEDLRRRALAAQVRVWGRR